MRGSGMSTMDHVTVAERSVYKARHRTGADKIRNGKACGKYTFCLYIA